MACVAFGTAQEADGHLPLHWVKPQPSLWGSSDPHQLYCWCKTRKSRALTTSKCTRDGVTSPHLALPHTPCHPESLHLGALWLRGRAGEPKTGPLCSPCCALPYQEPVAPASLGGITELPLGESPCRAP